MSGTERHEIRARAVLGLPLTATERAKYLLLIATEQEASAYLNREKAKEKK